MAPVLRVRQAQEKDIDRLVEIHASAYPGAQGYEQRKRWLTRSPFGTLADLRVVEDGARIVGHAALYAFELWLSGRVVPTFGIGAVGVAPEARGAGVARTLLESLHREIDARGGSLSLLYPFREQFYAQHGYGTTAPLLTMRVSSQALAHALWGQESEEPAPSIVGIEANELAQAKKLYAEVAMRSSGRLARSEARWMDLYASETQHFMGALSSAGRLDGYVIFSYRQQDLVGPTTLVVRELVAREGGAERALFDALGRQSDQVDIVEIAVPFGDPLPFAFLDSDGARRGTSSVGHTVGTLMAGPMVRIIDVRRALAQRGYQSDGELTVLCRDQKQADLLRLTVRDGVAEVRKGKGAPDIEIARSTLGSLIVAGIRPSEAEQLGLLRAKRSSLRLADDLFSAPRFHCLDSF